MEKLKVVVKKPQMAKEEVQMIDHSNEAIQSIVDGYYEAVTHPELGRDIIILCNENGMALNLPDNIWFGRYYILGTVIFTTANEEGEFVDLTDEQIKRISSFLWD